MQPYCPHADIRPASYLIPAVLAQQEADLDKDIQLFLKHGSADRFNETYLDLKLELVEATALQQLTFQHIHHMDILHAIQQTWQTDRIQMAQRLESAKQELEDCGQRLALLSAIREKDTVYEELSGGTPRARRHSKKGDE
jgi:hypothetical protein